MVGTFLAQFPIILLGFIAGAFVTRTLGPEGKGAIAMFAANSQLLILFLGISINTGLIYFTANKEIPFKKLLGIAFCIVFCGSAIGAALIFSPLSSTDLVLPEGYRTINYKAYLFSSFAITLFSSVLIGVFQGKKMYAVVNQISILNSIINAIIFSFIFFTDYLDILDNKIDNVFLYTLALVILNTTLYLIQYLRKIKVLPSLRLSFRSDLVPDFITKLKINHLVTPEILKEIT